MKLDDIPNEGVKVIIGTRTYLGPDWVHVDIDSTPLYFAKDKSYRPVDVVCDAKKLTLPDDYADFVFSSECLEHFSWRVYPDVLKEWCRIVKPGGSIRVDVPDFILACQQLLEWDCLDGDRRMQQIFFAEQLNPYDYHYVGLTPRMLTDDFEKMGFEIDHVKRGSDYGWLSVQARKPNA